ncbi:hypothetical protein B0T21DRAFT_343463 [Apiosordaria backusii]|uniref:Uncharacterized protein n=1 Tax=Apiosordaria backusii TaxID=314023 RepID=A0AA40EY66_9PEZI|nr:hypothetical protein B0T21DRAFT_343463 [Apiosordaria backusii]
MTEDGIWVDDFMHDAWARSRRSKASPGNERFIPYFPRRWRCLSKQVLMVVWFLSLTAADVPLCAVLPQGRIPKGSSRYQVLGRYVADRKTNLSSRGGRFRSKRLRHFVLVCGYRRTVATVQRAGRPSTMRPARINNQTGGPHTYSPVPTQSHLAPTTAPHTTGSWACHCQSTKVQPPGAGRERQPASQPRASGSQRATSQPVTNDATQNPIAPNEVDRRNWSSILIGK